MYRFLFRAVIAARAPSLSVYEANVLPLKRGEVASLRFRNGVEVKSHSTSCARLCQNRDNAVPTNQDEKVTVTGVKSEPAESPPVVAHQAEEDGTVITVAEQNQEAELSKTDNGGTTLHQDEKAVTDVKSEPAESPPVVAHQAEEDGTVITVAEQVERAELSKTDNGGTTSHQDEKAVTDVKSEPAESPPMVAHQAEEDGTVITVAEQVEQAELSKTDNGGTTLHQDEKAVTDVKSEPAESLPVIAHQAEEQNQDAEFSKTDDGSTTLYSDKIEQEESNLQKEKTTAPKSVKAGLLALLTTMKVETTTKRKLLNVEQRTESTTKPASQMEKTASMFQRATQGSPEGGLGPELLSAASAAAATLPNSSEAESQLLKQLRQHEAITEAQKTGDVINLGEIIADMKVGRESNRLNRRPIHEIQFDDDDRGYTDEKGISSVQSGFQKKNYGDRKLNIFSPVTDEDGTESVVARPTLWDMDFAHQIARSINKSPRNGLEEMIQWTKEGKMWQYPINNEAGLEDEAAVPFHEHIFLSKHLKEGFPQQGPVRHFMELVVAGLSKNPYLTVQQKKEHIFWFRDYFQQKEDILKDANVCLN